MATQTSKTREEPHMIDYDQFLKDGTKGYCDNLCTLKWMSIREDKCYMIDHLEKLKAEITKERGTSIEAFTIGKTHAAKKDKKKFDATKTSTWETEGGIGKRWNGFYDKGYDCLIVLYGFTKEVIPIDDEQTEQYLASADGQSGEKPLLSQHDWASKFESLLIHYYLVERKDPCLGNKSLESGDRCDKRTKCGVVYVAIKLKRVPTDPATEKLPSTATSEKEIETDTETVVPDLRLEDLRGTKKLPDTPFNDLIELKLLPTQKQLEDLQRSFLRTGSTTISEDLKHIGSLISTAFKSKLPDVKYVWLAYEKDNTDDIKVLVMIETSKEKKDIEKVFPDISYKIHTIPAPKFSQEAKGVRDMISQDDTFKPEDLDEVNICIRKHRVSLKRKHAHISIIKPSSVRSRGFKQGAHKIINEKCIAVYVRRKGYIPVGETALCSSIDGISVDVLEGIFVLCAASMGRPISGNADGYGTFGGFIDHPTFGLCGITNAHVLLNVDQMSILIQSETLRYEYFQNNTINVTVNGTEIGSVVEAVYTSGDDDCECGMEMAIFKIEEEFNPSDCDFWNESTKKDSYFGRLETLPYRSIQIGMTVDKSGATTGWTAGKVQGFCAQIFSQPDDSYQYELFDLISIEGVSPYTAFSRLGDSGTLVMTITEHRNVVAIIEGIDDDTDPKSVSYATPIEPVLQRFNSTLKRFRNQYHNPD